MFNVEAIIFTLAVMLLISIILWVLSLWKKDVGIVDSFWSIMIIICGLCFYYYAEGSYSERALVVLLLLFVWGIRLSVHITWRNWGQDEDSRYVAIRNNNQPYFELKSFYIVFLLQAFLAAVVSLPLMSVAMSSKEIILLDYIALSLWAIGMLFEAVGDYQLAKFKGNSRNTGKVMDKGLWRYSRHPNYFGEFCVWWSFFLFAVSSGYWWSIISPLLISVLLLKVSGVSLMESTITDRRPEYKDYVARTNAFFPWQPKRFLL